MADHSTDDPLVECMLIYPGKLSDPPLVRYTGHQVQVLLRASALDQLDADRADRRAAQRDISESLAGLAPEREQEPFVSAAPKKRPIPDSIRRRVFERDAYRCRHCGGWETLCVDHIIPESKGGPSHLDNYQTLCKSCNSRKGAR